MNILRKAWESIFKHRLKIQPLGNKVIVKRFELAGKSEGGIFLPVQEGKPNEGEVIAVGPGKLLKNGTRATPSVRKGDWVIFGILAGVDVKVDGEEFTIVDGEDIEACF